jgi:hypothetical protein
MHLIDLDKAKPGMTLAKPVSTLQDMLLLKPDVRLTEKNIHILKSWGIHEIWIVEETGEGPAASMVSENKLRTSIDNALRVKFSETLSDPLMEEILRIAGNLLEKRLLKKEKHHGTRKA